MTDKPYQGRRGGSYVRASRNEEPRRVDEAADGKATDAIADASDEAAAIPETTSPETGAPADKPARKRS